MATTQTQLKAVSEDAQDDELGPRDECWCADTGLPCFGHFRAEREETDDE